MILIYTLIALLVNMCIVKIAYILIQHGQMLGAWQKVIRKVSENKNWDWLAKPMGACEVCFSHVVTFINFWVYAALMISNNFWIGGVFNNIIMYISFVSVGAMFGTYMITKWT